MVEKTTSEVKHIADIVGEWGKWQRDLFIYVFLLWVASAINNMGYTFHTFKMEFWCSDVPIDFQNKTPEMKCYKFSNPNESCDHWAYDTTEFHETIISRFDLVCDRSNLASLTQSVYMLGYFVSGLVFSYFSDRYGRRPLVWLSFAIEIFAVISCAFSYNYIQYAISRFLLGIGSSGRGAAMAVLLLECLGPKYRADIYIYAGFGWVSGYIIVPILAYWLRDFQYMLLTSLLLLALLLIRFYFLYESPRWQITNGQIDSAEITLRKAIKQNGLTDNNLRQQLIQWEEYLRKTQSTDEEKKHYNITDLFKSPKLRIYTLIIWFTFMTVAFVYYGFSLNMSDFGGNFYITFLLSGVVELPSTLIAGFGLRFVGRSKLFSIFLFMITLCCLAVIPSQQSFLKVTFALMGKFAVSSSWSVMSVYAREVFPTVLRQTGYDSSSVVGRIGSIAAPYMKNLAANTSLTVVMIIYAIMSSIASGLVLILPETKDREIPDTIDEAENAGKSIN